MHRCWPWAQIPACAGSGRITLCVTGCCWLILLAGCHFASERAIGERLLADGELRAAYTVFDQIAVDYGDVRAGVRAGRIARQLAEESYEEARAWLDRGHADEAFHRLTRCLTLDPSHPRALALSHELHAESNQFEAWWHRYRDAVDASDWLEAVELARGPQLEHFRWPFRGRWNEFTDLAWSDLRREVERSPDLESLRRAVQRGAVFLTRYGVTEGTPRVGDARSCVLGLDRERQWQAELLFWRAQLEVASRVEALASEARSALQAGESEAAVRALRHAMFLRPESQSVREQLDEALDRALADLFAELAKHVEAERWGDALGAARRLERWGIRGDDPRRAAIPLPTLKQLHARELASVASSAEAEGRVGFALIQWLRAAGLDPEAPEFEREAGRLRGVLQAIPVVEVVGPGETPIRQDAPWVRCGTPEYIEQRRSLAFRQRADLYPVATVDRESPVHQIEQQRWLEHRTRVEELYAEWQAAQEVEKNPARERYDSAVRTLLESRQRLERMSPREARVAWQSDPSEIETRELLAELQIPLEVWAADRGRIEFVVHEKVRITDRMTQGRHGVPEDPDDLPAAEAARDQLAQRCEVRVQELLRSLELEERRAWFERAEAARFEGALEAAVELGVRVIVSAPTAGDPLREAALRWLVESGGVPAEVADRL